MNRRKFLRGLAAVPVAAVVVTKLPSAESLSKDILSNSAPIAQDMRHKEIWPTAEGFFHGEDPFRTAHQEALTKWLSDKVDQTAFEMMTGRLT